MSEIMVPDDPNRLPWAMTIGELLDQTVSRNPYKVYLYYHNYQVTYQELLYASLRTAGLFAELGIGHGDRVCLFLPNGREFLYIWMGLSRLGAICVPINIAYKPDEMAYMIDNAGAKALVSHETLMEVAQETAARCPSLEHKLVVHDGVARQAHHERATEPANHQRSNAPARPEQSIDPAHPELVEGQDSSLNQYPDWRNFWALLGKASQILPQHKRVSPEDVSMLVYTSGTTGNPKGVMITHQMYVAAGQGFATWTGATSEDRFFTCLPYFHANAQYYSTMGSLAAGASLVLVDRFSASQFWSQVRESKATIVNFIGMMMPVLLKQPTSPQDRDNTVRIFYGSPALAPELLQEFEQRFGAQVLIGFGLTETCYGTIERLGSPYHQGSSGKPRWHPDPRFQNELRIIDDGNVMLPNKIGEITLKNPAVMPGYWRDELRTRESLRDGWLHTGDLGWLDEEGNLYFVDRKKDVVRRRGENISSQEVEDVIKRHPGVLDCAVIAVPAELGEEEVKAYVVPKDIPLPQTLSHEKTAKLIPSLSMEEGQGGGQSPSPIKGEGWGEGEKARLKPEDVVYWCAERLAYFKVPRYIELRDELPRTPSMRVPKDVLRQEREDLTVGCFDREKAGIRLR